MARSDTATPHFCLLCREAIKGRGVVVKSELEEANRKHMMHPECAKKVGADV